MFQPRATSSNHHSALFSDKEVNTGRQIGVDMAKMFAIFFMVIIHTFEGGDADMETGLGYFFDSIAGAQFELNGLPIIMQEMKKTADQSGDNSVIFKDTKANADKRAKDAFASGIAKLREGGAGSYKGLVVVLKAMDNDTNKFNVIDKVTL